MKFTVGLLMQLLVLNNLFVDELTCSFQDELISGAVELQKELSKLIRNNLGYDALQVGLMSQALRSFTKRDIPGFHENWLLC